MSDITAGASVPARLLPVETPDALPGSPTPWPQRAICPGEDPDIFFPVYGDPGTRARQVCARCPVRAECMKSATANDEWGIWGGLDQEQRRALRDSADQGDSSIRVGEDEAAHD